LIAAIGRLTRLLAAFRTLASRDPAPWGRLPAKSLLAIELSSLLTTISGNTDPELGRRTLVQGAFD
jgi:hypothetical protein